MEYIKEKGLMLEFRDGTTHRIAVSHDKRRYTGSDGVSFQEFLESQAALEESDFQLLFVNGKSLTEADLRLPESILHKVEYVRGYALVTGVSVSGIKKNKVE